MKHHPLRTKKLYVLGALLIEQYNTYMQVCACSPAEISFYAINN